MPSEAVCISAGFRAFLMVSRVPLSSPGENGSSLFSLQEVTGLPAGSLGHAGPPGPTSGLRVGPSEPRASYLSSKFLPQSASLIWSLRSLDMS